MRRDWLCGAYANYIISTTDYMRAMPMSVYAVWMGDSVCVRVKLWRRSKHRLGDSMPASFAARRATCRICLLIFARVDVDASMPLHVCTHIHMCSTCTWQPWRWVKVSVDVCIFLLFAEYVVVCVLRCRVWLTAANTNKPLVELRVYCSKEFRFLHRKRRSHASDNTSGGLGVYSLIVEQLLMKTWKIPARHR